MMHSILLIDDESDNLKILTQLFKSDYRVFVAKSGQEGLNLINTVHPDVILLDIIMPDINGFEVLKAIKSQPETQHIPVIFITGLQDPDDEEKGLKLGASDYIQKPFHTGIVKARVNNTITLVHQKALLEELALIDPLTELSNRRKWEMESQFIWQRALTKSQTLVIGVIDIDCFKLYNDTYGHAAGDRALTCVAKYLNTEIQTLDGSLYRYGGEEFVFIIQASDLDTVQHKLIQLPNGLISKKIDHQASTVQPYITVSIGACIIEPSPIIDIDSVFEQADKLMYQAKYNGGNNTLVEELD
ncbi:diguanylate cyclase [Algibacillus agarilyticus]|uniref:diguanylate cyclase n=1 Tax=Algibacillus agarilyticus TaxID=2234133 RepID=UPI000DD095FF|nr:diguanylate cyclase [Algibacillus agarilyticus]